MGLKKVIKDFKTGNVCVCGVKGSGKDVLFGNVIARRKMPYASNVDYGGLRAPFSYDFTDVKNTYKELIKEQGNEYKCPYPRMTDVYVSDAGIYFPSQYCNELNKEFKTMPVYQALSRHLQRARFHVNSQNLNRVWDKIREQSDIYYNCRSCHFIKLPILGDIVIQKVIRYDKAESAINRVKPCRVRVPFWNLQARTNAKIYRDQFFNQHGEVKQMLLIYRNKSKHDTYSFDKLFARGCRIEKD